VIVEMLEETPRNATHWTARSTAAADGRVEVDGLADRAGVSVPGQSDEIACLVAVCTRVAVR
jgi:hypothetical protein